MADARRLLLCGCLFLLLCLLLLGGELRLVAGCCFNLSLGHVILLGRFAAVADNLPQVLRDVPQRRGGSAVFFSMPDASTSGRSHKQSRARRLSYTIMPHSTLPCQSICLKAWASVLPLRSPTYPKVSSLRAGPMYQPKVVAPTGSTGVSFCREKNMLFGSWNVRDRLHRLNR
jgi:hypothetical protein